MDGDLWQDFSISDHVQRTFHPLTFSVWPRVDILQYPSLFTTDPRAVNHILTHSEEFPKPQEAKVALELLGEGMRSVVTSNIFRVNLPYLQGLIFAEGERHRKQVSPRCSTNPSHLAYHPHLKRRIMVYFGAPKPIP